ncbi:MAG: hypothetical protein K6F61_04095 [Clostridiales bacterium]|nr:hypothetical protein [Clostridiales bacterium]
MAENKCRNFRTKTAKLKEILPMIRGGCYSNYDESGMNIVICPECEEWTHVSFNLNSGLIDLLGEITVESIDARDGDILLWIKTDEFNWFCVDGEEKDEEGL